MASSTSTRRVLVTGATGLVGFEVLDQLRGRPGVEVFGVSRRGSTADRDVVRWRMGTDPVPDELAGPWDVIVNTAADVRWSLPVEESYRANVATVAALEPLVSAATQVVQVSTAYAAGHRGDVSSTDPGDYRNAYEWSKAHAERLARELFPRLTVVRPPLIIGRRGDGRAARFSGMYTILRGIATSTVPAIAAGDGARFDLTPVDDLAGIVVQAVLAPEAHDGRVYVLAGGEDAPTVSEAIDIMVATLNEWRAARGRDPIEAPRVISPDRWNRFFLPFSRQHLSRRQNEMIDLLSVFEPYTESTISLARTHHIRDVRRCIPHAVRYWADVNPRLAAMQPAPWRSATTA
jgi:nucleoside-diphosphate-sugar epimerase